MMSSLYNIARNSTEWRFYWCNELPLNFLIRCIPEIILCFFVLGLLGNYVLVGELGTTIVLIAKLSSTILRPLHTTESEI